MRFVGGEGNPLRALGGATPRLPCPGFATRIGVRGFALRERRWGGNDGWWKGGVSRPYGLQPVEHSVGEEAAEERTGLAYWPGDVAGLWAAGAEGLRELRWQ